MASIANHRQVGRRLLGHCRPSSSSHTSAARGAARNGKSREHDYKMAASGGCRYVDKYAT